MCAVIKAHETADSKTGIKLKHMVTKQSLLLYNEQFLPVNTA